MGMGMPLDNLRRVAVTLEKTWKAWFQEPDQETRRRLARNFEYLLGELHTFGGYVREEWRSAFPKPPKKMPKYDQELQTRLVDKQK